MFVLSEWCPCGSTRTFTVVQFTESAGTNTGECKRYKCSYRCRELVKRNETQRRVWEGLPCCLPATLQIVYMVPRSGDSECTPLRSALSILFTLNLASQFTVGQLGNLGDDFNGPGTIATTTTRVSYGLEIGDEVHIDPTGSPIQLAGCPGSPMASIINNTAMVISTGFVSIGNTTPDRHFEVILTAESPPNALLIALRSSRPVCLVPGSWNGSNRAGENHCGTVCHNCLPALTEPCPDRNETSTARQLTLVLLPQDSQSGILLVLRVPRQGHFARASNLHFHPGEMMQASYRIGHQSLVITIGHESSLTTAIMGDPPCGHVMHVEGSVDQTPGTIWAYTIYTKHWLDCGVANMDIQVSSLLPTPHGRPPDPQGTIRPRGVECAPRNGPSPMLCWNQLNGSTGLDNWTRATTHAWNNGDTNATAVACFFDCAEKSNIARNHLDSQAPANLATAKPAIASLAATDDFFIAEREFYGTTDNGQFTTSVTASSGRVNRAVDHFVSIPGSNTAATTANHAIAQLPGTEGKLDLKFRGTSRDSLEVPTCFTPCRHSSWATTSL